MIGRRVAVLIVSVCLAIAVLPPGSRASAGEATGVHRLAILGGVAHMPLVRAGLQFRSPAAAPRRPAQLTPQGLRVPDSNFAPATIDPKNDLAISDNSLADTSFFGVKGSLGIHTKSYADLGRVTGYYQVAHWVPSAGSVNFYYHGSVMSSPSAAQSAQQDNVTHQQTYPVQVQVSPCPFNGSSNVPNCNVVFLPGLNGQGNTPYDVQNVAWAVASCLVETAVEYPDALSSNPSLFSQVGTTLSAITNAAAQQAGTLCADQSGGGPPIHPTATSTPVPHATPTKTATVRPTSTRTPVPSPTATDTAVPDTPTPTATATQTSGAGQQARFPISILAALVEKNGAPPDANRASLAKVKTKQVFQLTIYAQVRRGAAQGAELDFSFGVWKGKTPAVLKTVKETVGDILPTELRESLSTQLSKKGKYRFVASVRYAGRSTSQSTNFAVVAAKKAGH